MRTKLTKVGQNLGLNGIWSLPLIGGTMPYDYYLLHELVPNSPVQMRIHDIPAGVHHTDTLLDDMPEGAFIEVISGGVGCQWERHLESGQLPNYIGTGCFAEIGDPPSLRISNGSNAKARFIAIEALGKPSSPWPIGIRSILNVPPEHDERPAEIRERVKLRSLWKHTTLPGGVGYERVWIDGQVPKHRHQATRPGEKGSFALVIVLAGEGQCGRQNEGETAEVFSIWPGMVIAIPANTWHGFVGKGLEIISIQVPEIDDKYQFADDEFPYTCQ